MKGKEEVKDPGPCIVNAQVLRSFRPAQLNSRHRSPELHRKVSSKGCIIRFYSSVTDNLRAMRYTQSRARKCAEAGGTHPRFDTSACKTFRQHAMSGVLPLSLCDVFEVELSRAHAARLSDLHADVVQSYILHACPKTAYASCPAVPYVIVQRFLYYEAVTCTATALGTSHRRLL